MTEFLASDPSAFPVPSPATWRARVEKELGDADFERTLVTRLPGGLEIQPLYASPDGAPDPAGFPGLGPQVRGPLVLGTETGWEIVPFDDDHHDLLRDPLGDLARDGFLAASLDDALAELAPPTQDTTRDVGISTITHHDAGAHPTQELGFALATGLEYLRRLEAKGIEPREAAGRIVFRFAIDRDVFVEIAKLRAARLAWSRLLVACGVTDPPPIPIHVETSARTLSRRDPWTNMLRVTTQVFAAICGGADAIRSAPFDAALGVPEGLGRRVARNTQLILREESHLAHVLDPAGGSWYVEELTDRLARDAWDEMRIIEGAGGMARALVDGEIRRRVDESWQERLAGLATRKLPVTGVSEYPDVDELLPRPAPPPPPAPPHDAGVRIEPFPRRRDAAPFEAMRDAADAAATRPAVFLATLGPLPEHRTRAIFAENFFRVAGFEVIADPGTGEEVPADAARSLAKRFAESGAPIACLCGSDVRYPEFTPATARALREAGAKTLLLAGHGGEQEADYRAAGIDTFIHLRSNLLEILTGLLATGDAPVAQGGEA